MYNTESNELGLKYHGGNERLLQEMVDCENLSFFLVILHCIGTLMVINDGTRMSLDMYSTNFKI